MAHEQNKVVWEIPLCWPCYGHPQAKTIGGEDITMIKTLTSKITNIKLFSTTEKITEMKASEIVII